mgnify:FL=1
MKKYDVKIKVVKEHEIIVNATCREEAISKIEELVAGSEIQYLDIPNFTKHYIVIDIDKKPIFKRKHYR